MKEWLTDTIYFILGMIGIAISGIIGGIFVLITYLLVVFLNPKLYF